MAFPRNVYSMFRKYSRVRNQIVIFRSVNITFLKIVQLRNAIAEVGRLQLVINVTKLRSLVVWSFSLVISSTHLLQPQTKDKQTSNTLYCNTHCFARNINRDWMMFMLMILKCIFINIRGTMQLLTDVSSKKREFLLNDI